jgi:hypothetical protein
MEYCDFEGECRKCGIVSQIIGLVSGNLNRCKKNHTEKLLNVDVLLCVILGIVQVIIFSLIGNLLGTQRIQELL